MNTLNKLIKGDRIPILRNLVLFPILVSLDKDESLEVSLSFYSIFHGFLPLIWITVMLAYIEKLITITLYGISFLKKAMSFIGYI